MSPACSQMATLHHPPACPFLPTSLALDLMEGKRPREEASCRDLRAWAPGFLPLHICQRRQGGQGVSEEDPSMMGFCPWPLSH